MRCQWPSVGGVCCSCGCAQGSCKGEDLMHGACGHCDCWWESLDDAGGYRHGHAVHFTSDPGQLVLVERPVSPFA